MRVGSYGVKELERRISALKNIVASGRNVFPTDTKYIRAYEKQLRDKSET